MSNIAVTSSFAGERAKEIVLSPLKESSYHYYGVIDENYEEKTMAQTFKTMMGRDLQGRAKIEFFDGLLKMGDDSGSEQFSIDIDCQDPAVINLANIFVTQFGVTTHGDDGTMSEPAKLAMRFQSEFQTGAIRVKDKTYQIRIGRNVQSLSPISIEYFIDGKSYSLFSGWSGPN